MPFDHPMRSSPGGEILFHMQRERIIGARAVRPVRYLIFAARRAA